MGFLFLHVVVIYQVLGPRWNHKKNITETQ